MVIKPIEQHDNGEQMKTIENIKDSMEKFAKQGGLTGMPEIVMSRDVFAEVLADYDKHFGFRRYVDQELPEGHVRIVCRKGKFLLKALYKVATR